MDIDLTKAQVPIYRLRVAKEVGNLILVTCCLPVLVSVRAWTALGALAVAQSAYFALECVCLRKREKVDPDFLLGPRADPLLLAGAVALNVYFHVMLLVFAEALGGTVGVFGCVDFLMNSSERLVRSSAGRIGAVFCACCMFYLGAVKAVDLFSRTDSRLLARLTLVFVAFAATHEALQATVFLRAAGDLAVVLTSVCLAGLALALAIAGLAAEGRAYPDVTKALVIAACWSAFAGRAVGLAEATNEPGLEAHAFSAALALVLAVFVSASNAAPGEGKKEDGNGAEKPTATRYVDGIAGGLRRRLR